MPELAIPDLRRRDRAIAYFESESAFWNDVYADRGVLAEVYRGRQARALAWIDALALPPGSRVLDVGCGSGRMSLALAERGFRVHAIDPAASMIEQARRNAVGSAAAERLTLEVGDVRSLACGDGSFDLVVALGVIPWLDRPGLAVREMARVVRPGGVVVLTADNASGLARLVDPWMSPAIAPVRRRAKAAAEAAGFRRRPPEPTPHRRRAIDRMLLDGGLLPARATTVGFAPTFRGRSLLPEAVAAVVHRRLQRLADRGVPVFRSIGVFYLVLAEKPMAQRAHSPRARAGR